MTDKAERLHSLISKLLNAATTQFVMRENGTQHTIMDSALWRGFNALSENLGYSDYGEFRDAFLALCHSVRSDIAVIPMQKDTVRATWLTCVKNISSVFDAKNFGSSTREAFTNHFSERNLEVLDSISERFQSAEIRESTNEELEQALQAVRETVEEFQASGKLNPRIAAILKHYLQQMETVFFHVRDFGDDTFWKLYKETFATFMQLHPVIAEMENSEAIKSKLTVVAEKLTAKSIAGLSIAANVATVGSSLFLLG